MSKKQLLKLEEYLDGQALTRPLDCELAESDQLPGIKDLFELEMHGKPAKHHRIFVAPQGKKYLLQISAKPRGIGQQFTGLDWTELKRALMKFFNSIHWMIGNNPGSQPKRAKKATKTKGKPKKQARKQHQIPPPFKKLTKKKIVTLKKLFRVHPEVNPDPGDCPSCGMEYKDFKTGLNFQDIKDMLWIQDPNSEFWRHKRRGSVLGLWFEIKRGMWADHQAMCGGEPLTQAQYLEHLEEMEEY